MLYFAYGSNMSMQRMSERVPAATAFGIGYLLGWRIVFNKRSSDGSGKANLVANDDDVTWGVLYKLELEGLLRLDRLEKGYQRHMVHVQLPEMAPVEATTYISGDISDDAVAYDWYKAYLVSGAFEFGLPESWQAHLAALPSRPDPRRSHQHFT